MSEWFWKRLSYAAGWITVFLLFAGILFAANIEIKDLDLWLHLATGEYIRTHHVVPAADIFSCTVAKTPWVNHEWLFQVLVSSVYNLAGFDGLIGLQVAVVGMTLALLVILGFSRERQLVPLFLLFLIVPIYQMRFTLRPDLFSLLFLTLYIYVLGFHLRSSWSLWVLFVLQVVWVNTHGFFIFGPMVIALNLVGEWVKKTFSLPFQWGKVGRLSVKEYGRLQEILFVVILACLFNPYSFKGAAYPLRVLFSLPGEGRIFFEHIQELQNPISWQTLFSLNAYAEFKILILISLLGFLLNFRRLDIGAFAFWLIFLLFSLNASRNVPFFAFAAYFTFLMNLPSMSTARLFHFRWVNKNYYHIASLSLKVLLMVGIFGLIDQFSLRGYYDFDKFERKTEIGGVSLRNYPHRAVDFLVQNDIRGNFFNDFNSGAYLIGRRFPHIKVFIDGRTEVYGPGFFDVYRRIWAGDVVLFEDVARRYQLIGAFLNSVSAPASTGLISYLYDHKDWVLVYFDYDAAIFLKDVPQNKAWIERYALDLSKWEVPKIDVLKLGLSKATPYQQMNRAYALFNMKLFDKALQEAREGLKVEPYNPRLFMLLGKISIAQGDYLSAFEYLRNAKLMDPQDIWIRYHLAVSLYHLGQLPQAKDQCQFILGKTPRHAKTMYLLSLVYAKERNYELSRHFLQEAYRSEPKATDQIVAIGKVLLEQKQYDRAKEVCEMALESNPRDPRAAEALREIGRASGKK